MRTERNLATYVFSNLSGHERVREGVSRWVSKNEPGLGSTIGAADALAMNRFTREVVPIEFKMAKLIPHPDQELGKPRLIRDEALSAGKEVPVLRHNTKGRKLRISRIRPTQIAWHEELRRHGGKSRFVIGVHSDESCTSWEVWFTDDCSYDFLKDWRDGFELSDLTRLATAGIFDLAAWDTGAFGPSLLRSPIQNRDELRGAVEDIDQERASP